MKTQRQTDWSQGSLRMETISLHIFPCTKRDVTLFLKHFPQQALKKPCQTNLSRAQSKLVFGPPD